jgi:hypothetical protein
MARKRVGPEGIIVREGKKFVVRVQSTMSPESRAKYGVTCENPDAKSEDWICRKEFTRKRIFLPHQLADAIDTVLAGDDTFVLSMNGYSQISEAQCRQYGFRVDSYEESCAATLRNIIKRLRRSFKGATLRMTSGASELGVDLAIEWVAKEFNIPCLGFSCPRYMLYVADDERPVYVAKTVEEYADAYIRSLDLLIATGGREQALKHDVAAACIYNKRIHFIDILSALSTTGGVPATIRGADGKVRVENAARAFGTNISFFSREDAIRYTPAGGDLWDAIFRDARAVATQVCRNKMSAKRMFR